MNNPTDRASAFARGAINLYTALLAAGETEISRRLLEATMIAAAAVARVSRYIDYHSAYLPPDEGVLCDELLRKSLFWICQAPDSVAQEHGGFAFREALRLLLWLEEATAVRNVSADPGERLGGDPGGRLAAETGEVRRIAERGSFS